MTTISEWCLHHQFELLPKERSSITLKSNMTMQDFSSKLKFITIMIKGFYNSIPITDNENNYEGINMTRSLRHLDLAILRFDEKVADGTSIVKWGE